jgi:hypothetical protein
MAVGWSRDGAVEEQIEATVESAIQLARSRLPDGEGLTHCEEAAMVVYMCKPYNNHIIHS